MEPGDRNVWRGLVKWLLSQCPGGGSPINRRLLKADMGLLCNGRQMHGWFYTHQDIKAYQLRSCPVWFGNGMFHVICIL